VFAPGVRADAITGRYNLHWTWNIKFGKEMLIDFSILHISKSESSGDTEDPAVCKERYS
jgi:hypothetical protein